MIASIEEQATIARILEHLGGTAFLTCAASVPAKQQDEYENEKIARAHHET